MRFSNYVTWNSNPKCVLAACASQPHEINPNNLSQRVRDTVFCVQRLLFETGNRASALAVQSGVAGGHAKWFRALPAVAPPKRRSVTECRPMTPGAGPSAETECEANARAPQPPSAALLGYGMLTRIPILSDCYRSAILDLARDVDD